MDVPHCMLCGSEKNLTFVTMSPAARALFLEEFPGSDPDAELKREGICAACKALPIAEYRGKLLAHAEGIMWEMMRAARKEKR